MLQEKHEIEIPQINANEEKGKKRLWTAGIVTACLVVVLLLAVTLWKVYFSDERRLLKGISVLSEEALAVKNIWKERSDSELYEVFDKGQLTAVLNISGEELPITLGLDTKTMRDVDARKMKSDISISVSNMKLAEMILYGDKKQVIFSLPDFWKQNLSFGTTHIEQQYNQSMWAEIFGNIGEEEITLDLFQKSKTEEKEIAEKLAEEIDFKKLLEEVTIEKEATNGKEGTNGKEAEQYRVTIPQAVWEEAVASDVVSDVVCLIELDKKNRIQTIQIEEMEVLTNSVNEAISISGTISFQGEQRSIDDIHVMLETKLPMQALQLEEELQSVMEIFGNQRGVEDYITILTDVNLSFDENDIGVSADLNELTISVDRIGTYKIRGSVKAEPLSDGISPLEGEIIPLFEMTQREYEDLAQQFMNYVNKWERVLQ